MGAGAGFGGFGAGFAKGLAGQLTARWDRQREQRIRDQERKDREFQTLLPIHVQLGMDSGDMRGVEDFISQHDPDMAKELKKTQMLHAAPLFNWNQQAPKTAGVGAAQEATGGGGAGGGQPALLPSANPASADVTTPGQRPGSTFFGTPVLTEDDKFRRQVEARRGVAQRLGMDPEDSVRYSATGQMSPISASSGQSVRGTVTMPDGRKLPAFGSFDKRTQKHVAVNPETGQVDPSLPFAPLTSANTASMGDLAERAARSLTDQHGNPYANAAAAYADGRGADVDAKVNELAQGTSYARGTGTGAAAIQTDLDKPIGPTAAQQYNVPPTTTLRQLSTMSGLQPEQQQKIATLSQVDTLLQQINDGLVKVFPNVQPGITGRIQSQLSLGMQKLAADDDLASLDTSINLALAQIAQLSGQPGSRLSDRDVEIARSALAELKPKLFGGDTLRTAQARLGVVTALLEKAKTGIINQQGAPAPANPVVKPPATMTPAPSHTPGAAPTTPRPVGAGRTPAAAAASPAGPAGWRVDLATGKLIPPGQ